MTPSADLFDLIKSLSKSQKRYFKLFSGLHAGGKDYLKLFDEIEKQKKYNEEEIKHVFKKEVFIKQLTRTKYYLYQLILKSVRSYRAQQTSQKQLRELLDDIDFLFSQRLYEQCDKLLRKARVIAMEYEHTTYLIEIINWELALRQQLKNTTHNFIRQHYKEKTAIARDMYDNGRLREEYSGAMVRIEKAGFTRNKQELKKLENYFKHLLLYDESQAISYRSKLDFYSAKSTYYFFKNDFYNAYLMCKKIIEVQESHPAIIEERPASYVAAIQNAVTSIIHSKQFSEWNLFTEKLGKLKKQVKLSDDLFVEVFNIEIAYYLLMGKFEEGVKFYEDERSKVEEIDFKKLNPQQRKIYYISISKVFFGLNNFKAANTWANKLINDDNIDTREDMYCITRMYSLIINLELGKQDLLEYSVKSTIRFLDRRNRLYKLESVVLSFLKKYPLQAGKSREKIALYKELKKEMDKLTRDPYEAKAFVFFDFQSWVESKLNNKSYQEMIQQKSGV